MIIVRLSPDPLLSRGCDDYRRIVSMGGTCRTKRRMRSAYTEVTFQTADSRTACLAGELLRRFGGRMLEPSRVARALYNNDDPSKLAPAYAELLQTIQLGMTNTEDER